jgi:hypothetical protein
LQSLTESSIGCPYCGEMITVLLNPEDIGQPYIEDCQVCCRPIEFLVYEGAMGELEASVQTDSE